MASEPRTFDPSRHLSLISGNEYLEVKWRLVWLRTEHPDAVIETNLVRLEGNFAVFEAKVTIPSGGSATGYGSEDSQGFRDFIEKAETKAVGRALAGLGFGTQFCTDFDFGATQGRVVDSPVALRNVPNNQAPRQASGASGGKLASDRQMGAIYAISRKLGMEPDRLGEFAENVIGVYETGTKDNPLITAKQASDLIEALSAEQEATGNQ